MNEAPCDDAHSYDAHLKDHSKDLLLHVTNVKEMPALRRDSAVLRIFLFTTLVLGPAQAYLFARLLDAPLAALAPFLVSRAAQGLVLVAVRAATAAPWYAQRRTEALCAAFALLSAFQLDSNRRLLVLSAGASPMAQALIATCVAVALAFHAALPLVEPSPRPPRRRRTRRRACRRRVMLWSHSSSPCSSNLAIGAMHSPFLVRSGGMYPRLSARSKSVRTLSFFASNGA